MKVLMINGSPHKNGNTFLALSEVASVLQKNGIETEIVSIGAKAVQGCISCHKCVQLGRCVFKDDLYNTVHEKLETADALIVGSPTYFAGPTGSLCALLDRLFYSASNLLQNKPAAAVAICRRAGSVTTFDRLNKYFMMTNMPVATSQYWNCAYGTQTGDVQQDAEGLQTLRTLGNNMAWMLKSLKDGGHSAPEREDRIITSFIR